METIEEERQIVLTSRTEEDRLTEKLLIEDFNMVETEHQETEVSQETEVEVIQDQGISIRIESIQTTSRGMEKRMETKEANLLKEHLLLKH